MIQKPSVLLTGASGSMGYEAFKLLWDKRDAYNIVLLLRPSRQNKRLFRRYAQSDTDGSLKIVWGDVLNRDNVTEACTGIDYCLHLAALISPAADRDPEMAWKVNYEGTKCLVEAIEAEDPDRIRFVYIGSVAEYGDRLPPIHVGRTGDPIIPSVYDQYALSKIHAELTVMQSNITYKVSLRQTFIMIPGLFSLMDPIMFHQPIHSFMENVTAMDSGRLLVNCLEQPDDSGFWNSYYNISGGPKCRITFLEFLYRIYAMLGLRYEKVMERNWFALKNFHMQFFEDADRLNTHLHHWEGGYSMEDFYAEVWKQLPWYLKITAKISKGFPPFRWLIEKITYQQLKKLANKEEGTMNWIRNGDDEKIKVFYGSAEAYRNIPDWHIDMPDLDHHQEYKRLDHGYDETKSNVELEDLKQAARFRGGVLRKGEEETGWEGDMHEKVKWRCCQGHEFEMTPHAILKGGHWCLECISEPWDRKPLAEGNAFARQVL